jgi:hypothetical protein
MKHLDLELADRTNHSKTIIEGIRIAGRATSTHHPHKPTT